MKSDCCCCNWLWLWCSVDDDFVDVDGIAVGSGKVVAVYDGAAVVDGDETIVELILLEWLDF